jgi:membrane glycosyltransferase
MQADATEDTLFVRRVLFALSFVVTMAGSLGLAALALAPGGWGLLDIATLVLLAVVLPWMVAGFWNAVIGFVILRFAADPAAEVPPSIKRLRNDEPIVASTAILLCIRNEPPARIIRNLEPMLAGLDASGYGEHFHLYVLSDTNARVSPRRRRHRFRSWQDAGAIASRSPTDAVT